MVCFWRFMRLRVGVWGVSLYFLPPTPPRSVPGPAWVVLGLGSGWFLRFLPFLHPQGLWQNGERDRALKGAKLVLSLTLVQAPRRATDLYPSVR